MKKLAFVIVMGILGAPLSARADLTHKIQSSIQLNVNAAATQVSRTPNVYSVSGNNVTTTATDSNGASYNTIGAMTVTASTGVGAIPSIGAVQATAGESWSFTQSWNQGDAITSTLTTGAVSAFGDQTSTAAGTKDSLAGTIDSSGTVTLTAGGAGTSALGQFTTELSIQ
ncbi:MAG: hypothetical protein CM15mV15_0480 [uncultured marine virus]|nr:MAG: hypothetical protein CM15mV15_0480 [uncultured marine virus]